MRRFTSFITAHYTDRQLIVLGITFLAIVFFGRLGSAIFHPPATFLPSAGIGLAALVLEGAMLWPAIAAGTLLFLLTLDVPIVLALAITLGHTLHAVIGAQLLQFLKFDPVVRRVRDMFAFLITALAVAWIIPSLGFIGSTLQESLGGQGVLVTPFSWWLGVALSNVIIGALTIRWIAKPGFTRTRNETIEIIVAHVVLLLVSFNLFWVVNSSEISFSVFMYEFYWEVGRQNSGLAVLAFLTPFVWFVLRLGMRFTLLAFTVSTFFAITGVLYSGAYAPEDMSMRLIAIEIFLLAVAGVFYPFIAVVEERARGERDLKAQLDRIKTLLTKVQSEDRAKNEFLAVFSHELRNPLAPIVSSVELLKLKGFIDPERKKIFDVIDEHVQTITRLLDDLLDISRISRKTFKLKREAVDVRSLIENSVRAADDLIKSKSHTVELEFPPTPVMLFADPVRIKQILINLINNAAKYTNPGGSIIIVVSVVGEYAVIEIKDTGIGIKPEMLRRIFEPFTQLQSTHQHRATSEGLGIGLSLTEKLVVMHGGVIEAHSEGEGHGSTFTARIPLADKQLLSTATPISTPSSVLIVDTNETAGYAVGQILQSHGHLVDYATSGAEAIQKTLQGKPDGIIMDLKLPDMDGYAVARELREVENFEGLIVGVNAFGEDGDRIKAKSAGFDYLWTKPIEPARVEAILRHS